MRTEVTARCSAKARTGPGRTGSPPKKLVECYSFVCTVTGIRGDIACISIRFLTFFVLHMALALHKSAPWIRTSESAYVRLVCIRCAPIAPTPLVRSVRMHLASTGVPPPNTSSPIYYVSRAWALSVALTPALFTTLERNRIATRLDVSKFSIATCFLSSTSLRLRPPLGISRVADPFHIQALKTVAGRGVGNEK